MANLHFQVVLHGQSNLAQDDAVSNFYFDHDGDGESVADGLVNAYFDLRARINSFYSGATVKWYPLAGGQPLGQKDYTDPVGSGGSTPTEVALCLSYAAVDDVDASTARRRGRVYLPIAGNGARPSPDQIDAVLDFGESVAQIGFATGTTWHLYSRADNVMAKIESIWCDNAWDTQRRRGVAPTDRTIRDVQ